MSKLKEQKEAVIKAREEKLHKLREAVNVFVDSFINGSDYNRWNTTSVEATITKILICLNSYKHQLIGKWMPLYEEVTNDYNSKKTGSKQYVENFYRAVMKLEETMHKDGWSYVNNAIDDNSVDVLMAFLDVAKTKFSLRYNWDNYDFIKSNIGLSYRLLSDFDTNFRGKIEKFHNINDTYKIIETKKFNNEEGVKAWESSFYNINDSGTYYSTFNDALICTMFGRFSNAAIVLFQTMEQERIEQEEQEKEKQLKKSLTTK